MKKKIAILDMLFTLIFIITAHGMNVYNVSLIGEIEVGKEKGLIGWNDTIASAGLGPLQIIINNDFELYLSDIFNDRINIYNLELKYLRSIEINAKSPSKNICIASKWKLDDYGNLIGTGHGLGLIKINNKGEILYSFRTNQISDNVWSKGAYFPYNDNILYYEGNKKNDKIKIIDKGGKIQENENIIVEIDKANLDNVKGIFRILSDNNNENTTKLYNFLKSKKIVLYNEKLLTGRCEDIREYYYLLMETSKNKVMDRVNSKANASINFNVYNLLGFDNEKNSYWDSISDKKYIAIFSKYGELLDHFTMEKIIISTAIAPNGDIYFFNSKPIDNKFHFYKITRRW